MFAVIAGVLLDRCYPVAGVDRSDALGDSPVNIRRSVWSASARKHYVFGVPVKRFARSVLPVGFIEILRINPVACHVVQGSVVVIGCSVWLPIQRFWICFARHLFCSISKKVLLCGWLGLDWIGLGGHVKLPRITGVVF